MSKELSKQSAASLPAAPYVGMRPFEQNEQAIFFGRDMDAALLGDKVFSARLTVFYGPSGVGKSSILRTLLVPHLEEQEARVIYFDDWRADDPIVTLKARLVEEATKLKIPDAGVGGPKLTDLVRLLINADGRTVVFILDQFEEFFAAHGDRIDPFRKELADLVRMPGLDVRILLSLREEHVASLEPFRNEILNLFQSTDRLEPLNAKSVQEAIEGPARLFGVEYEPDLVKELLTNLRQDQRGATGKEGASAEAPGDLPLLQLVCNELWKEIKRRDSSHFREEEFRDGYTIKALCDRLEVDGFALAKNTIGELNKLLITDLYGKIKHKIKAPSEKLKKLEESYEREKNDGNLRRLNRIALEECYPQDSPKSQMLTRVLYHDLGGLQGILDAYLRRVMPSDWNAQVFTAQLMQYLAPPDGHKVSFSVAHLAGLTKFPENRVWAELDRLSASEVGVLRSRQYGAGNILYELMHDSFIRIIEPWRDDILRREADLEQERLSRKEALERARRRRPRNIAVGLVILLIMSVVAVFLKDRHDLYTNTTEVWNDSHLSVQQKFDDVAYYLIWARRGPKRLDRLKNELIEHRSELPLGYGVDRSGIDIGNIPQDEKWPFTLRYSSARLEGDQYFKYLFTKTWQDLAARSLNQMWGIPVPLKLRLIPEETYPREHVELTGDQIEPLELSLMSREKDAFFSSKDISQRGKEFLERFKNDWTPVEQLEYGGPWWVVPRWSLPAWKASGIVATDGSGLTALLLARELQKHPDRLVTPYAVEILLDRGAKKYPQTVAEARAMRGKRLVGDLQEIVKQGYGLVGLPNMLDLLASYSEGSSVEVAEKVIIDIDSNKANLPRRLRGPHGGVAEERAEQSNSPKEIHEAYKEAVRWLPDIEPEIRIYLGENLDRAWIAENNNLKPEYRERVEEIRDSVFRRFGVVIQIPETRRFGWDPKLSSDAFRIEVLNEGEKHPDAQQVIVNENDALDQLSSSLAFRIESNRMHFLSAERVNDVLKHDMKAPLREWLLKQYSLTDLKLLLRSVINPSDKEIADRMNALDVNKMENKFTIPTENSIRHASWLLASLAFWTKVHDSKSLPTMTEDLRVTQLGRFIPNKNVTFKNPEIDKFMEDGISALNEGHVSEAEDLFSRAVALDKSNAISTFPVLYSRQFQKERIQNLIASCEDLGLPFEKSTGSKVANDLKKLLHKLRAVTRGLQLRTDLEDYLEEKNFDQKKGVSTDRRLRLCLLASYPEYYNQKRRMLYKDIIKRYSSKKGWPLDEAAWFGKELIVNFNSLSDNRMLVENGVAFLQLGINQLIVQEANERLDDVIKTCETPGPNRWCWNMLPTLAEARRDGISEVLVASVLASQEVRSDIELALKLADQARRRLRNVLLPKKLRESLLDQADLTYAIGILNLEKNGAVDRIKEAETILSRLQNSPYVANSAYLEMAELEMRDRRFKDARAILETAIKRWPNDVELYGKELALELMLGDKNGVSQIALEAHKKVKRDSNGKVTEETQGFSFVAALGLLIAETGPWEQTAREFLGTKHPNVPYIAMLLFSRMTGKGQKEAKEVIEHRWAGAHPETWHERMREGDITAWREMLIGYYLGSDKVDHDAIFANLENEERFAKSDLKYVPLSRLGMLCEAYFYEALLAESKGDKIEMRQSLEKALKTDVRDYFEYAMAKFLLSQELRFSKQDDEPKRVP